CVTMISDTSYCYAYTITTLGRDGLVFKLYNTVLLANPPLRNLEEFRERSLYNDAPDPDVKRRSPATECAKP
ncbi:4075_t:CDS:2, partial [Ambispora leptoticha]